MASSVSSYFILAQSNSERIVNEDKDKKTHGKEERVTKGNNNKHVILTRNELTRKRMELIKTKLEESRAKYFEKLQNQTLNCSRPIPRVADVFTPMKNKEANESTIAEISNQVEPITTNEVPCIYYVVSPERRFNINSSRQKFKNKERQKEGKNCKQLPTRPTVTFTSKEDYGITTVRSRMAELEHTLGIRPLQSPNKPIPHKQITFPLPVKTPPKNPPVTPATTITYSIGSKNLPATPATTVTNSAGHNGREWDLGDFDTINEKPIKMTICEDNEIVESNGNIPKELTQCRASDKLMSTKQIELPFISLDEQRKALGTGGSYRIKSLDFVRKSVSQDSPQKKVHFAEAVDAPSVQGNQIGLSFGEVFPFLGKRALTVPDFSFEKSKSLSDIYHIQSLPETRILHTSNGRQKKHIKSLDLPKIDIVSSVYDQLIIKAIQTYIRNFPPYSRQSQVAKQILDQLENKKISIADLNRKQCKIAGEDIENLPREQSQWEKFQNGPIKRAPTKKSYSQVEPKCFRMILPGASQP